MPSTTPINALRYAAQTDAPVASTAFGNLASDVDNKLVARFASTTARDTAIPSPIEGMVCHISGSGTSFGYLQIYDGSAWVALFRSPQYVRKTADEIVANSTVLQSDDHLTLAMRASATYQLDVNLVYVGISSTTAGGIRWDVTMPTGSSFYGGQVNAVLLGSISGTAGPVNTVAANKTGITSLAESGLAAGTWSGTATVGMLLVVRGLIITSTTAGNATFQWAQSIASATATTVRSGSWMTLTRLA